MASAATVVKQAREAAGLTQAELARRLDVTQPVVARLERAGANPRLATLERVVAATGRTLEISLAPDFGIDEAMIAADLKRTPAERLTQFEDFYRFAASVGGTALRGS